MWGFVRWRLGGKGDPMNESDNMKINCFGKFISWPLGTLILYGLLRNVLYENWLPKFWNLLNLTEGVWMDISVSLLAIASLLLGWYSMKRHYSCHHVGILISIVIITLLYYYDNDSIPYLYYLGIVPCWFVLLGFWGLGFVAHYLFDWISPLFRKRTVAEKLPIVRLFQDRPVCKVSNDGLAYNVLAKRITSAIINNTWDESFSIGVTGSWGTGKSTMLLFVKDLLEKRDDIIILEFNPRRSSTVQDIQKDFLSQLAEALGKYHSGAVKIAQKYMQAIGALPDSLWAANLLCNVSDLDVQHSRDSIVDVINHIGKKIVVLIDDFDRLSGEEIQEVLKLIDKNAAFPHSFFVTAYDKKHTNQVISNYMGHSVEDDVADYTDKYFNIEVSLPWRRQSNYVVVLRECLYDLADNHNIVFGRNEIDEVLPKLYPHIAKFLPSIRDIKRYINLISLTLPLVEDDVLLGDFLLVGLIRYKYPEEYKKLGRFEYVIREGGSKCLKLNGGSFEKVGSKEILKVLFNGKEPLYKSISNVHSFTNYFYDIDSGHLPYRKLSVLTTPSITPDEFKLKVKELVNNDYAKKDFVEFVLSFENKIHNEEEAAWYFRFFLMARTYCESRDLYIATLSYLLKDNVSKNVKQFGFSNEAAYIGFLKDALNDKYDYRISIESLHDALHAVNSLDTGEVPTLVFTSDELMTFARKKLEKAIGVIPKSEEQLEDVYKAYKACVIEYIQNGGGEGIDSVATEMLKAAIKENPDFYMKDVLCHRKSPNHKSAIQFFMERIPYRDLFKNTDDFEVFINVGVKGGDKSLMLCMSQYAEICKAQNTWEPTMTIKGDISGVKQHDYSMYNKLFEGEFVDS